MARDRRKNIPFRNPPLSILLTTSTVTPIAIPVLLLLPATQDLSLYFALLSVGLYLSMGIDTEYFVFTIVERERRNKFYYVDRECLHWRACYKFHRFLRWTILFGLFIDWFIIGSFLFLRSIPRTNTELRLCRGIYWNSDGSIQYRPKNGKILKFPCQAKIIPASAYIVM
jgi:hypothetical protein